MSYIIVDIFLFERSPSFFSSLPLPLCVCLCVCITALTWRRKDNFQESVIFFSCVKAGLVSYYFSSWTSYSRIAGLSALSQLFCLNHPHCLRCSGITDVPCHLWLLLWVSGMELWPSGFCCGWFYPQSSLERLCQSWALLSNTCHRYCLIA